MPALTKENWKQAISDALNGLPKNVRSSVDRRQGTGDSVEIYWAGNEPSSPPIVILSRLETLRAFRQQKSASGEWNPMEEMLHGPDGQFSDQGDTPIVEVNDLEQGIISGILEGPDAYNLLVVTVHNAIIHALMMVGIINSAEMAENLYRCEDGVIIQWEDGGQ